MTTGYGKIGYVETVETSPGVWSEVVTERTYYGDIERNTIRRNAPSDSTNDDLTVNSQLSIIADPFAYQKFGYIAYAEFMGTMVKVTSVDPTRFPRLILTLGGVYNGKQA